MTGKWKPEHFKGGELDQDWAQNVSEIERLRTDNERLRHYNSRMANMLADLYNERAPHERTTGPGFDR